VDNRAAEKIIVLVYSIYALALMFATTILNWPLWIAPITSVGIVTAWIIYLREVRNYRFRALLYSVVVLITFVLYNMQENSFGGILTTYCAAIIVLSILDIPDIVIPEYICTVLLITYHGLFTDTIPHATTQEKIRSAVQILSVFAVVGITHRLIKKHEINKRNMRQAIEKLEQSQLDNMKFLANASRALSAPADIICSASEAVLREDAPQGITENALRIQAAGRSLISMTGDMLFFSELETGKAAFEEKPYHLPSAINEVISAALSGIGNKELELIADCDPRLPSSLLGDGPKLRRLIMILLDNALKYTETGSVTLSVSARPEQYGVNLCVKVRDTGAGISAEKLEKLFTSQSCANGQPNSLGLGLITAKEIISGMNGFISARSEPGKGSEFQFVVPQRVADPRPIAKVRNAEGTSILFYVNTEKASFAAIRDEYMRSACHMLEGLGLRYYLCRSLSELKRGANSGIYTHVLITRDEYLEDAAYFDSIAAQLGVIMIQGRHASPAGAGIAALYTPFSPPAFAALLNGDSHAAVAPGKAFTAPEACVLVVDDNLLNLKAMEELLRPYKIKTATAASGEECLAKLERISCDMVFMDYLMPGINGVETARRIRKLQGAGYQDMPIIALTANTDEGAREMFLEEGFREYISKPVAPPAIDSVLRRHLPADKLIYGGAPNRPAGAAAPAPAPERSSLLNRSKGIRYMGGSPEAYEEILNVYLDEGLKLTGLLQDEYLSGDWENYLIHVHSLKSNSFGIGADNLGEMARALETACKAGDMAYIQENHEQLIELYSKVLSEIIKERGASPSPGSGQSSEGGIRL